MRGIALAGERLIARPAVAATPPVQRKAVGRCVKAIRAIRAVWAIRTVRSVAALPLLRRLLMRLSAGDEGRQPFDVLLALLREVLRAGLRVLRLHLRVLLLARIERLLLARRKRFAADRGLLVVAIVVAVVGKIAARARLAAGNRAGSGGTVPGRQRSGGSSAPRADSSFPRRSGRRNSARRAQAEDIFRRRGTPFP